jgi:autoinducer 2-degrading protein
MHLTLVHVHVKPEYLNAFIAATHANHQGVKDPGNLHFDVLQDPANAAHKQTPHYLTWRETVAEYPFRPPACFTLTPLPEGEGAKC